jgi:hypothetical protein
MPKANARSRPAKRAAKAAGRKPVSAKGAAPRKASAGRPGARRASATNVAKAKPSKVGRNAKKMATAVEAKAASQPRAGEKLAGARTLPGAKEKVSVDGRGEGGLRQGSAFPATPGLSTSVGAGGRGLGAGIRSAEGRASGKRNDADGVAALESAAGRATTEPLPAGVAGGAAPASHWGATNSPTDDAHPGLPVPIASFTI